MKKLAIVLGAAVLMTATMFAQGRDLSGTWNLDAAKTGPLPTAPAAKDGGESAGSRRAGPGGPPKIFIKQTDKTISISMGTEANALTANFDGTESDLPSGSKGKVAWKRDRLDVTVTNSHGAQTMGFYREGAWLVVEIPIPGNAGAAKLYYSKAAPAK